jgi:TonB family protein
VRRAEDETGLIPKHGSEEGLNYQLSVYLSMAYAKLPWFFQKQARGPGVAPSGALDYCQGGTVSLRKTGVLLAVMAVAAGVGVTGLRGQDAATEIVRRAKSKVQPVYPELARKMNLSGTVKVEVVVAPNGTVKEAKVVGGHPVLANAALEAVKKWRFEPAAMESSGVVDFKFEPH